MILQNSLGLTFDFLENGSVKSIEVDPIRIGLRPTTPFSKSGTNIFLRKRANPIEYTALIGPESNSLFSIEDDGFIAKGCWNGIDYLCCLRLSKKSLSWQWSIEIKNNSRNGVELDVIYLQDAGLKPINAGLINEYYVSQYLERLILEDKNYGSVVCCRQNMREKGGNPWLMMACKNGAISASTDGMQFYGTSYRESAIPEGLLAEKLGGEYAGESSVIALQENPFGLAVGETHRSIFVTTYQPDHPLATSAEDLSRIPSLMLELDGEIPSSSKRDWFTPAKNLFNTSPFFPVDNLNGKDLVEFFGKEKYHVEKDNGQLLSFFN